MVPETAQKQKMPMDAATYMEHMLKYKKSHVCTICLGTTRDPVQSPCDHVFCRICYDRLTNITATDPKGMQCPSCRQRWNRRPPSTSPLHQIALDTYLEVIKLHNKLARLNGKRQDFVPESQVLDFAGDFPTPKVLTPQPKPIYYSLKTPPCRAVQVQENEPRPVFLGADESTVREPPQRAQGTGTEPKEVVEAQAQCNNEDFVASKQVQVTEEPKENNEAGVQTAVLAPGETQTALSFFNRSERDTQVETPVSVEQQAQTQTPVVCDAWTEPNGQPESELPAGRKRKAIELEDSTVGDVDFSAEDLGEWRRLSGLDVVTSFERRLPGFTDLVESSEDVQLLVDHWHSVIASRAHETATNVQNDETAPPEKRLRGEEPMEEENEDGMADPLSDDTVNDAELMQAARDAERAIELEREQERQLRAQSIAQNTVPVFVSSPNVFDLFGHHADPAPEVDDDDGLSTKSQDGDEEKLDDHGQNVDSGAFAQQVIVPETQVLSDELNQDADSELLQEDDDYDDYVTDSLENDPFASSQDRQQSPVHQPVVLAEQNVQVQPIIAHVEEEEQVQQLHPQQMVICLSGLNEFMKTAREFRDAFGVGCMTREFGDVVTHVVVQTNDDCDMPLKHRTYKYFWGMAAKKYVVSHLWFVDSLIQGQILPEEGYEVRRDLVLSEGSRPEDYACRRARMEKSRLFVDYTFYPLSENSWMKTRFAGAFRYDQMLILLEEAGAEVVEQPDQLPDTLDEDQNPMAYILFPYRSADSRDMNREAERFSKRYRRQVMPADWVIDSIISNTVIQDERLDLLMPKRARRSQ